ncbi:hypothetical protein SKAU_G00373800 [Synaphobranchus kaupii]|uniref:Uncharacterized protein n=1 Tax=Synaphobranchus kaupii TaxID=118154 RepID=A0A9Q1IG87_SYNKA|nr:hypothetical protein SKAU_G00373800 [Synaphobranchus kaupii]
MTSCQRETVSRPGSARRQTPVLRSSDPRRPGRRVQKECAQCVYKRQLSAPAERKTCAFFAAAEGTTRLRPFESPMPMTAKAPHQTPGRKVRLLLKRMLMISEPCRHNGGARLTLRLRVNEAERLFEQTLSSDRWKLRPSRIPE